MASLHLVDGELGMIIENVKIDKIVFIKKYTPEKWLHGTFSGGMPPKLLRG
jgi:hypothetical protein